MKTLLHFFAAILLSQIAFGTAKAADYTDSQGYPVLYLRGSFNGWSYSESTRFTRSGDTYTLTIKSLDGAFKISGTEWNYNLGSPGAILDIAGTCSSTLVQDGKDLIAHNLKDLTITFKYQADEKGKAIPCTGEFTIASAPKAVTPTNTLPVIYIDVYMADADGNLITDANGNYIHNNEIIYKDLAHKNYLQGTYYLDINGCKWLEDLGAESIGSKSKPLPLEIKARGNWSRTGYSKKPYKLKLGKKQNMLGLTAAKSKHYALLAHADDAYGFMRNFVGFNLGHRVGLPWTPSQQPVEVVINGDYRGIYFLTESIRVGDGRIMIDELADNETDLSKISGGYLVELDNYDEENQIRLNEKTCVGGHLLDVLRVTFDTPEQYSDIQRRFVTDQFTAMNDLVGANSDDLWSYLDLDDFVRYYLVKELLGDAEAFHGSTYLFRDRGPNQKWHFSPIWDCGQAFNAPASDFFYNHDPYGNYWVPSVRTNATFNNKLAHTWLWVESSCLDGLFDDIDLYVDHISAAAANDWKRWAKFPAPNGGTNVCNNTDMQSRKAQVINNLRTKFQTLNHSVANPYNNIYSEPERDKTPAALLPEYVSGIDTPIADPTSFAPEYFDLYGRHVIRPIPGTLYIERQGNQTRKLIFKQ